MDTWGAQAKDRDTNKRNIFCLSKKKETFFGPLFTAFSLVVPVYLY
jgi:hypothetical protein